MSTKKKSVIALLVVFCAGLIIFIAALIHKITDHHEITYYGYVYSEDQEEREQKKITLTYTKSGILWQRDYISGTIMINDQVIMEVNDKFPVFRLNDNIKVWPVMYYQELENSFVSALVYLANNDAYIAVLTSQNTVLIEGCKGQWDAEIVNQNRALYSK